MVVIYKANDVIQVRKFFGLVKGGDHHAFHAGIMGSFRSFGCVFEYEAVGWLLVQ